MDGLITTEQSPWIHGLPGSASQELQRQRVSGMHFACNCYLFIVMGFAHRTHPRTDGLYRSRHGAPQWWWRDREHGHTSTRDYYHHSAGPSSGWRNSTAGGIKSSNRSVPGFSRWCSRSIVTATDPRSVAYPSSLSAPCRVSVRVEERRNTYSEDT